MSEPEKNKPDNPHSETGNNPARNTTPVQDTHSKSSSVSKKNPLNVPRGGLSLFALLIAGLALVIGGGGVGTGYWAWMQFNNQLNQQRMSEKHQLSVIFAKLNATKSALSGLASREALSILQTQQTKMGQQLRAQQQMLKTLQQDIRNVQQQAQRTPEGWKIAGIEYLLRVARYRLDLIHDYRGAITALKAANRELAALANPNLLPARQALVKEIIVLRAFHHPDRIGIMLELTQIVDHLGALTKVVPELTSQIHLPPKNMIKPTPSLTSGSMHTILNDIWASLSKNIIIRYHDEPVLGMAAISSQIYSNQVLRLRLEAASLAVMNDDNNEFHLQIQAALAWLKKHYQPQAVSPIEVELKKLDQINISPPPPKLGAALDLLKATSSSGSASKISVP